MDAVRFDTVTVLDHKYINTGGHTMVSVFTVFYDDLGVRYIICNEEGYTEQFIDTISHEIPPEMNLDDIILGSRRWDEVLRTELSYDVFGLYSYCHFEFLKEFCKTFDVNVTVHVYQLPDNLYGTLTEEELLWHLENEQEVLTNGYNVYLSDYYDAAHHTASADEELVKVVDFKKDLSDKLSAALNSESLQDYYDKHFVLAFDGQFVELPFDAETYGKVEELLDSVIDNW